MTERENYLLAMSGQKPQWVPNFSKAVDMIIPAIFISHLMTEEKRDFFSVPWTINESGPMIDCRIPPVMTDVNDWRKFVHFPDVDSFDWETASKMQLADHDPNKAILILPNLGGGTMFMPLMNMMGFADGLCALVEEPEVCKELFAYITDFYEKCIPYVVKYYKPDVYIVGDDLCTAQNSFVSMNIYREIMKPFYQRQIDAVHRAGLPAELHMCGKCEEYVEDFVEMGATSWQPAQGLNDISRLQKKYGKKLIIVGTWSTDGPAEKPDATEEVVRGEVRRCLDTYAADGGVVFWDGGALGAGEDQLQRRAWVNDEMEKYGKTFYQSC